MQPGRSNEGVAIGWRITMDPESTSLAAKIKVREAQTIEYARVNDTLVPLEGGSRLLEPGEYMALVNPSHSPWRGPWTFTIEPYEDIWGPDE